jgi:predicted acyl esterase
VFLFRCDVYRAFRKGHRLMVQVQSSWLPLVDRKPQRFLDIPKALPADFQKATQRIYRPAALPSSIAVSVEGASRPLQTALTR